MRFSSSCRTIFLLALAGIITVQLTACAPISISSSESSGLSSAQPIAPEASLLSFPEALPASALQSPFLADALEQGAVIAGADDVATDAQTPRRFWQRLQEGKDATLDIFQVYEHNRVDGNSNRYGSKLTLEHHAGQTTLYYTQGDGWDFSSAETSPGYVLDAIELTEYGYLVYQEAESSEPSSAKVISDYDIFENAAEQQSAYNRYLAPIFYSGALGTSAWNSPAELEASLVWIFEDIYHYEGGSPWDDFGEHWPVSTMLEVLSRYFDGFTKQDIINDRFAQGYDPDTDTIFYQGGRGGGPFMLRVTKQVQEGDLLHLHYEHFDHVTGRPYEDAFFVLTVKLLPDQGFRYLSHKKA